MKFGSRLSVARMSAVLLASTVAVASIAAAVANWAVLGERHVRDRVDHDTIVVTARRGSFDALKFAVSGNPVHFKKVVVHYRNGKEEIDLRDVIPAGGESRVIDLKGGNRNIRRIDFWYEANSVGRAGAKIKVFGRH